MRKKTPLPEPRPVTELHAFNRLILSVRDHNGSVKFIDGPAVLAYIRDLKAALAAAGAEYERARTVLQDK